MRIRRRKYANRYPWDRWFQRPRFVLVHGRDFFCLVHGMVGMIRNQARLKGAAVHIRVRSATKIEVEVNDGIPRSSKVPALQR